MARRSLGRAARPRVVVLAAIGLALHGIDGWLSATGSGGLWRGLGSLGWLAWACAARAGLGEVGRIGGATIQSPDPAGPRLSRTAGWLHALGVVALGEALRHCAFTTPVGDIEGPVVAALNEAPVAAVAAFAIAPALGEEMFFRGSLLRAGARRHGPALAWVLSSAAFALVHPRQLLAAAVFGAAAAALALATGRSREAVAAHAVHNLLGLRFLGL